MADRNLEGGVCNPPASARGRNTKSNQRMAMVKEQSEPKTEKA